MQERLLRDAAHFPGEPGKWRYPAAVLANFDRAVGREFFETSLQFAREVHDDEYKGNNCIVNYSFLGVNRMPEMRTRGCWMFQEEGMCSKEISKSRRSPGAKGVVCGANTARDSRRTTWPSWSENSTVSSTSDNGRSPTFVRRPARVVTSWFRKFSARLSARFSI